MQTNMAVEGTSPYRQRKRPGKTAHPSDVIALAEGGEDTQPAARWEQELHNILRLAKMGAAIIIKAVQNILRQMEGNPVVVDSQEGEVCEGDEVRRLLRQILLHILTTADPEQAQITVFQPEEQVELLHELLQGERKPLKRRKATAKTQIDMPGTTEEPPPQSVQGEHIIKFMHLAWRLGCS